jgi:hypothetical protein
MIAVLVVAVCMVWTFPGESASPSEPGDKSDTLRIGTFNTRLVALAFGRSEMKNKVIEGLGEAAEKARVLGDHERLAAVEAEAQMHQDRIHRQVFGNAPIDNILDMIEKDLPGIAKAAGVQVISGEVHFSDPSVEIVDITEHMARPFKPDEKTRKMMEELRKSQPLPNDRFPLDCEKHGKK